MGGARRQKTENRNQKKKKKFSWIKPAEHQNCTPLYKYLAEIRRCVPFFSYRYDYNLLLKFFMPHRYYPPGPFKRFKLGAIPVPVFFWTGFIRLTGGICLRVYIFSDLRCLRNSAITVLEGIARERDTLTRKSCRGRKHSMIFDTEVFLFRYKQLHFGKWASDRIELKPRIFHGSTLKT
jgi:hypothetical protein